MKKSIVSETSTNDITEVQQVTQSHREVNQDAAFEENDQQSDRDSVTQDAGAPSGLSSPRETDEDVSPRIEPEVSRFTADCWDYSFCNF